MRRRREGNLRFKTVFGNRTSLSVRLTDELMDIGITETTKQSDNDQMVVTEVITHKGKKGVFITKE